MWESESFILLGVGRYRSYNYRRGVTTTLTDTNRMYIICVGATLAVARRRNGARCLFSGGGTPPLRWLWAFIRNRMLGAGRFFVVGDGYSISRNEMRPPAVEVRVDLRREQAPALHRLGRSFCGSRGVRGVCLREGEPLPYGDCGRSSVTASLVRDVFSL